MRSVLLGVAVVCAMVTAKPTESLIVQDTRSISPAGFVNTGLVNPKMTLNLRMALEHSNFEGLHDALMDVSTPGLATYGQHLTKSEVTSRLSYRVPSLIRPQAETFMRPTSESLGVVTSFFDANNIKLTSISDAHDWMSFAITVGEANELFGANFSAFKHLASQKTLVRTASYSLPQSIAEHVVAIHPTTSFAVFNPKQPHDLTPIKSSGLPNSKNLTEELETSNDVPSEFSSVFTPASQSSSHSVFEQHCCIWVR
jgi:tripeptidyl-peptidase-1